MKEKYKDKELTLQDEKDINEEIKKTEVISKIVRRLILMNKSFNPENLDKYESLPPKCFYEISKLLEKHDEDKYDYDSLLQAEDEFEKLVISPKTMG